MTLAKARPVNARLFIAVDPPPTALDHLADFIAGLGFVRAGVRVTARRLWHVTLAFLGEVSEERLPEVVAALDRAATAATPTPVARGAATPMPVAPDDPMTMPVAPDDPMSMAAAARLPVARLIGGGRFGRGPATIVWAGVEGGLAPLRRATTGALRRARLPYDAKRFHPHLTLGRPGDKVPPEVIGADLAALAGYRGPEWTIAGLVLYRSQLGPRPVYEPVHSTPFTAPGSSAPLGPEPDPPARLGPKPDPPAPLGPKPDPPAPLAAPGS